MGINRRRFIQFVGSGIILSPTKFLLAHDQLSGRQCSEIKQDIAKNEEKATGLLNKFYNALREEEELIGGGYNITRFVEPEYSLRQQLLKTVDSIPNEQLSCFVKNEYYALAQAYEQAELSLIPEGLEQYQTWKTRDKIIKPSKSVYRTQLSNPCDERIFDVTVDIFLEAMYLNGIKGIKGAIKKSISQDQEITEKFEKIAKMFKFKDWGQLLDTVTATLDLFSRVGIGNLFIRVLGRTEGRWVWHKFLRQLRVRFIPFVGQVYTAFAFGKAIYSNKRRLFHAIRC